MPHTRIQERRDRLSLLFKCLIGALSLFGVIFACATATQDGYSAWYKRLLYFTQQSNIWIGVTALLSVLYTVHPTLRKKARTRTVLHALTYIFTVSITLTGVIFCALLAPFAEENIWTFSSLITHVAVPILAIADLFVCDAHEPLPRLCTLLSLVSPFLYYVVSIGLGAMGVDFGKGETYPYFFMDLSTGLHPFGYRWGGDRPELGPLWWVVVLLLFILGVASLYYALHPSTRRKKRKNQAS